MKDFFVLNILVCLLAGKFAKNEYRDVCALLSCDSKQCRLLFFSILFNLASIFFAFISNETDNASVFRNRNLFQFSCLRDGSRFNEFYMCVYTHAYVCVTFCAKSYYSGFSVPFFVLVSFTSNS